VSNATLSHAFVSAKADSADATLIRPGNWNAPHKWTGGSDKDLLARDTGAPDGASWVGVDATLQITGASGSRVLGAIPIPAGSVISFAGASAPDGWLLCDGSAVSRTTFSGLFATIGESYGVGDGVTTFNLPNLKGRVPVGHDAGQVEFDVLAETGGEKTHTLSEAEMPSHTHTSPGGGSFVTNTGTGAFGLIAGTVINDGAGSLVLSTGGGAAHNNLPPYIVMNYIIKS
jgi:microcystin-dependent protein